MKDNKDIKVKQYNFFTNAHDTVKKLKNKIYRSTQHKCQHKKTNKRLASKWGREVGQNRLGPVLVELKSTIWQGEAMSVDRHKT